MNEFERRLRKLEAHMPPVRPKKTYKYTWDDWTEEELRLGSEGQATEEMNQKFMDTKPRDPSEPGYVDLSHLSDQELEQAIVYYDELETTER